MSGFGSISFLSSHDFLVSASQVARRVVASILVMSSLILGDWVFSISACAVHNARLEGIELGKSDFGRKGSNSDFMSRCALQVCSRLLDSPLKKSCYK